MKKPGSANLRAGKKARKQGKPPGNSGVNKPVRKEAIVPTPMMHVKRNPTQTQKL